MSQSEANATLKDLPLDVAVLGGAFDPPHIGHLAMAIAALRSGFAREIWILPSPDRPDKTMQRPFSQRFDLVKTLLAESKAFEVKDIKPSTFENEQGVFRGSLFLIANLRSSYPGKHFGFLMGADTLEKVMTWNDPTTEVMTGQDFLRSVPALIFSRNGCQAQPLLEEYAKKFAIHLQTHAADDLDTVVQNHQLSVSREPGIIRLSEISSTRVRDELAKSTPDWRFLLSCLGENLLTKLDPRFSQLNQQNK